MALTQMLIMIVMLMMVATLLQTVWAEQDDNLNAVGSTNTRDTSSNSISAAAYRCILLIGGAPLRNETAEYYYPMEGIECDVDAIGNLSHPTIANTAEHTSGCYLSNTEQIVIREALRPEKPPMLYGLRDSSAIQLPFPYQHSSGSSPYTHYTTAASISSSACVSCGGKNASNSVLEECYQIDSSSPTNWTQIAPLPRPLYGSASVSMGDSYFIIGGSGDFYRSKQLFRYSVSERRWYEETSMAEERVYHAAAALSSTEFIVCGGITARKDCEVYNTAQKRWRRVGNLSNGRDTFALVKFGQSVYAIGGWSYLARLDSVEQYDGETEEWMLVKKLNHSRHGFVAVVV